MPIKPATTVLLYLLASNAIAQDNSFAENWHQWRGPNANGVSMTADPPVLWSEEKNIKWKVAIDGDGTSTPIIWGDKVFVLTAITKIPHEGAHHDNDFASASPTTDGERLYCWFGSAGLYCYDLNGNRLWERELGEARVGSSLGEGCSPVIHKVPELRYEDS